MVPEYALQGIVCSFVLLPQGGLRCSHSLFSECVQIDHPGKATRQQAQNPRRAFWENEGQKQTGIGSQSTADQRRAA
jgi:hypothetical protein